MCLCLCCICKIKLNGTLILCSVGCVRRERKTETRPSWCRRQSQLSDCSDKDRSAVVSLRHNQLHTPPPPFSLYLSLSFSPPFPLAQCFSVSSKSPIFKSLCILKRQMMIPFVTLARLIRNSERTNGGGVFFFSPQIYFRIFRFIGWVDSSFYWWCLEMSAADTKRTKKMNTLSEKLEVIVENNT